MYSKLSFRLFLIGQSPCHPLSLHPDGRGRGRGQGGPVNADGLLPGGRLAPSRAGEWGGLQGQISLNNFHEVGSQTQKWGQCAEDSSRMPKKRAKPALAHSRAPPQYLRHTRCSMRRKTSQEDTDSDLHRGLFCSQSKIHGAY